MVRRIISLTASSIAAVGLLAAEAVSAAPPPLPLPRERMAPAVAIWRDHPVTDAELLSHAKLVVRDFTWAQIQRAMPRVKSKALVQSKKRQALESWYWNSIEPLVLDKRQAFEECMAEHWASSLSPGDLTQLRAFLATDAGSRFWKASGFRDREAGRCLGQVLNFELVSRLGGAWKLLDVRTPIDPPPTP